MMFCPTIEYFNCEKGILILKKERFDNKVDYDNALYIYDKVISNLIKICKESYLIENSQIFSLNINEQDRLKLTKFLSSVRISDSYNSSSFTSIYNVIKICIEDRNEDFAFKVIYDSLINNKVNGIPFDLNVLLNRILLGPEEDTENTHFIRKNRIDSKKEDNVKEYIDNIVNNYPNEMEYILPSKQLCK